MCGYCRQHKDPQYHRTDALQKRGHGPKMHAFPQRLCLGAQHAQGVSIEAHPAAAEDAASAVSGLMGCTSSVSAAKLVMDAFCFLGDGDMLPAQMTRLQVSGDGQSSASKPAAHSVKECELMSWAVEIAGFDEGLVHALLLSKGSEPGAHLHSDLPRAATINKRTAAAPIRGLVWSVCTEQSLQEHWPVASPTVGTALATAPEHRGCRLLRSRCPLAATAPTRRCRTVPVPAAGPEQLATRGQNHTIRRAASFRE